MNAPLLSICVISYNHEKFIKKALESVAAQQINFDIELILADDCSKDNTRTIIEEFLSTYTGKVNYLKRDINLGPAANFINMIGAAKGKYVAYLEGDDFWLQPYKLQKQVEFLEKNPFVAISGHNSMIMPQIGNPYLFNIQKKYLNKPYDNLYNINDYLVKDFFHSSAIVYRNSMLPELPKWYPNAFGGDYFLVLLLSMNGSIHYINEPLSVYRTNPDSISHYSSRMEINKNFNSHLEKFNTYSKNKYDSFIKGTVFTRKFGLYYYHPSYLNKLFFSLKNLFRIVKMDQTAFPFIHRFRIFLPTFLLRSKVNLFSKKNIF